MYIMSGCNRRCFAIQTPSILRGHHTGARNRRQQIDEHIPISQPVFDRSERAFLSPHKSARLFVLYCPLFILWCDGAGMQAGKRPHPEDIHPAFLGYFHRPRSPNAAWDPVVSGSPHNCVHGISEAVCLLTLHRFLHQPRLQYHVIQYHEHFRLNFHSGDASSPASFFTSSFARHVLTRIATYPLVTCSLILANASTSTGSCQSVCGDLHVSSTANTHGTYSTYLLFSEVYGTNNKRTSDGCVLLPCTLFGSCDRLSSSGSSRAP